MEPVNRYLYNKVKEEAKQRFKRWPSAYASGWVVRTYKQRGGKYSGKKVTSGIDRWFKEQWVDVCQLPKVVPCGRAKSSPNKYPYCRPMKEVKNAVSGKTPKTVNKFSVSELKKRCKAKRKSPSTMIR